MAAGTDAKGAAVPGDADPPEPEPADPGSDDPAGNGDPAGSGDPPKRSKLGLLVVALMVIGAAAVVAGFVWLSRGSGSGSSSTPDYSRLSILLIVGTVSLLLVM